MPKELLFAAIDQARNILESDSSESSLTKAIESLTSIEKSSRIENDEKSNSLVLEAIASLCISRNPDDIEKYVSLFAKKRSSIKKAVSNMVKVILAHATEVGVAGNISRAESVLMIVLRITEGKIHLEAERSQAVRSLSRLLEVSGRTEEAAKLILETPIETYGSVPRSERVDFILEQVRLAALIRDWNQAQVMSRKINPRMFDRKSGIKPDANHFSDVREKDMEAIDSELLDSFMVRYYELLVIIALHEENYIDCSKHYRKVLQSPTIKSNQVGKKQALMLCIVYAILAPRTLDVDAHLNTIISEKIFDDVPEFLSLVKLFQMQEIITWEAMEKDYGKSFALLPMEVFDPNTEEGRSRMENLRMRILEHNLDVIQSCYSKISLSHLASLINLSDVGSAEKAIAKRIRDKVEQGDLSYLNSKIDRISGVVFFVPKPTEESVYSKHTSSVNTILKGLVDLTHLIAKEQTLSA